MGTVYVEWDVLVPVGKPFGRGRGTQRMRRETRQAGPFRSWQAAKDWRAKNGVSGRRLFIDRSA